MNLPKDINKNKIYDFYIKLRENLSLGDDLLTHIKLPEYNISIPEDKDEFFDLLRDFNWQDISYISFFVQEKFFINLDFIEEKIQITSEEEDLEAKIKGLILSSFKEV